MALSNIFVEPRREITESLVGIGIVLLPCVAWYLISDYLAGITWDPNYMEHGKLEVALYPLWVVGHMFITALAALLIWAISAGFPIFTHFVGDEICDALQRRNINLRPVERYRRDWEGKIERSN